MMMSSNTIFFRASISNIKAIQQANAHDVGYTELFSTSRSLRSCAG